MDSRRLPIIKLWDRILVPMQGEITDDLAEELSSEVLRTIHESGARGLVIDLTAVWLVDSHLCNVLSNLAAAARLMGTPTILSGLSPEIAMTLQTMGVEMSAVQTALTLEDALGKLGLEVRDTEEERWDDDEQDEEPDAEAPRASAPRERTPSWGTGDDEAREALRAPVRWGR